MSALWILVVWSVQRDGGLPLMRLPLALALLLALATTVQAQEAGLTYEPGKGVSIPGGEAYAIGGRPVMQADPGPFCGGSVAVGLCSGVGGPDPILGNTTIGGLAGFSLPPDSGASRQNVLAGNGAGANLWRGDGKNVAAGAGALQGCWHATYSDMIGIGDNACADVCAGAETVCVGGASGYTAGGGGVRLVNPFRSSFLGYGAGASDPNVRGGLAFGAYALVGADHQAVIGSTTEPITDLYVESGGAPFVIRSSGRINLEGGLTGTLTLRAGKPCLVTVDHGRIMAATCQQGGQGAR